MTPLNAYPETHTDWMTMSETATHHPIRDLPILVYTGQNDSVAFIGDGSKLSFPYFRAATDDLARAKAEAFVAKAIAEHEAAFLARQAAAEDARQKRADKAARNAA